jgi:hypothetical protein
VSYLSYAIRNVGKNKLTGLVPSGLLERSKTKSLSLRYMPHTPAILIHILNIKYIVLSLTLISSILFKKMHISPI